ncbi:MAG: FMN-binding protein [Peptococcia bacterium]
MKILVRVALIFIVILIAGTFYLTHGLNEGKNIELEGVVPSQLEDGVYNGKYSAGRWSNSLNVIVKHQKISEINIIDDVTFAIPGVSDELFNKVIEEQNTIVDAVSGATVTSKAYLKSIENALNNQKGGSK